MRLAPKLTQPSYVGCAHEITHVGENNMICERCTYGTGVHICLRWGASRREPKVLKGYDIHAVDVTVSEWSTEPWRAQLNSLAYNMRKLAERMEAIAVDSHAIGSLIRRERWTQDHMSALLTHVKHANNDTYVPEVQN